MVLEGNMATTQTAAAAPLGNPSTKDCISQVDDVNIEQVAPLIPPQILMEDIPIDREILSLVKRTRQEIQAILEGKDDRLVVVVGPCSIHDAEQALEYCKLLVPLREKYSDDLLIVMRSYFEKPRTTVGWKGLINDPMMDGSFQINKGLKIGRKLLVDLNTLGMPVAVEFLDTISPQFIGDIVAWGAIGARTTESQVHRELASGLSCPVGFKNGTGGCVQVAVDAIKSSSSPHRFLSVTKHSIAGIVTTRGNKGSHLILRGGRQGPNYGPEHIKEASAALKKSDISESSIMIDCSHANSNKDHKNQPKVADSVCEQVSTGERAVMGVMIESNLNEGNQKLQVGINQSELKYGISVTDACVSFQQTVPIIERLAAAVQARRKC